DRFRGRVSTVVGFDGASGWGLDMSGMPMVLDLEEIETPRLVFAALSGRWTDEEAFDVELDPAHSDHLVVALRLALRGTAEGATLLLDRATWLPRRLERPLVGWERTWDFDDYGADDGILLPRRLTRTQGGLTEVDRFETLATQAGDPATVYRAITTEPDDVRYDAAIAPRIELMKIRTGHVFARPKIDGEEAGWFAFDTGSGAGFTLLPEMAERLAMARF